MAAVFPLDTTKPWVFNGVTYEYDATEDRWYVVSTAATDQVVENINTLNQDVIRGFDERDDLIEIASSKNNSQDAAISELDQRVDTLSEAVGILEFKGRYKYVLEKSADACNTAYAQCLLDAAGDVPSMSECQRIKSECDAAISDPYPDGSFTSTNTTNVINEVDEFIFTSVDLDGISFDWINLVEEDDYIELFEKNNGDTSLYQCVQEPTIASTQVGIKVKFLKQTGLGDGNFNLQEEYEIRILKSKVGLDVISADERYVRKPYVVYFEDNAADITPQHFSGNLQNGELWYDTDSLELFVYNNNAWTASARPPSADNTFQSLQADVDQLRQEAYTNAQNLNSVVSDALLENNIYYSDSAPTGDITGTLRNGDLWVDSDDLTIKFYSMGAWVNPDRQVGGDYLETTGGEMTGDLEIKGGPEMGGANIYLWNNGFIRFGWGSTPGQLYGGYVFMRDENHFEIGTYSDKDIKLKGGSIHINGLNDVRYALTDAHYFRKNVVFNNSSGNYNAKISDSNFDIYNLGRFNQGFVVKASGVGIAGANSFASYPAYTTYEGRIENDKDIVNKKYADEADIFVYKAYDTLSSSDFADPSNDGWFTASNPFNQTNAFWFFSDIDRNGKLLNLRNHPSSHDVKIFISIGVFEGTYLTDHAVNRDGLKTIYTGYVSQTTRIQTGPLNNKVNIPGWELFIELGDGTSGIPADLIKTTKTYYIKFGGLL